MKKTSIIFLLVLISCGPSKAEMQIEKEAIAEAERQAQAEADLDAWFSTSTTSSTSTTIYSSTTARKSECEEWSVLLEDIKIGLIFFSYPNSTAMASFSSFDRTAVSSYSDPETVARLKYEIAEANFPLSHLDRQTEEFIEITNQGINVNKLTEEHLSVALLLRSFVAQYIDFYINLDASFKVDFIDNKKMAKATSQLTELIGIRDEINLLIGSINGPYNLDPTPSFCIEISGE